MKQTLLTDFELAETGVKKILQYFEDRLNKHRLANDTEDKPGEDPRYLRGRIAEIKHLHRLLGIEKQLTGKPNTK